jgi:hypothetical protein
MSVKERFRREKVGLGVFMQVQDTCKLVPCARSRGDWLDDHDQHHTAFLWCYRNQLPRWPTSEQHRFLVVRLFPRYRFQRNTKGVVRYASLLSADPPLLHAGGRSAKQTTLLHSSTSETTAPPGHSLDKMDNKSQNSDGNCDDTAGDRDAPSSGQPFSNSWPDEPLTPAESIKVTKILRACKQNDRQQLVELATTSGGLVEDRVRRIACT